MHYFTIFFLHYYGIIRKKNNDFNSREKNPKAAFVLAKFKKQDFLATCILIPIKQNIPYLQVI